MYKRPAAARWFAIHFIAIKRQGSVVHKSESSVPIPSRTERLKELALGNQERRHADINGASAPG